MFKTYNSILYPERALNTKDILDEGLRDEEIFKLNHQENAKMKNIEGIHLGCNYIKVWFWSPFPLIDSTFADLEVNSDLDTARSESV